MGEFLIRGVEGKERRSRVCPVPRLELIRQTYDRFEQSVNATSASSKARHASDQSNATLQICSIATLAARRKNGRRMLDNIGVVVVDEAHQRHDESIASCRNGPMSYSSGCRPRHGRRGWSALGKADCLRDDRGADRARQGTSQRRAVRVRHVCPGKVPELGKVKNNIEGNDYDTGALGKVMNDDALVGDIVKTSKELGQDRPTFAFCVNRAHGKHVNKCFNEAGIASEYMDGNTPATVRDEIFQRSGQASPGSFARSAFSSQASMRMFAA